jgi:hypothetical protein
MFVNMLSKCMDSEYTYAEYSYVRSMFWNHQYVYRMVYDMQYVYRMVYDMQFVYEVTVSENIVNSVRNHSD